MKKLLLDEHPLIILPSLAEAVGLNEAIILQQVHYWLLKRLHFYDGKHWVYNSYEKWSNQFPFFTARQIQYAIKNLEEHKILITGNYNKLGMDQTKWYTIDYEVLDKICPLNKFVNSDNVDVKPICKDVQTTYTNVKTIGTNVKPIPETTTEITTENTPTLERENLFKTFWNLYDKKNNIKKVKEKFLSLNDSDIKKIFSHSPKYVKSTPDKKFRKNPLKYLIDETWKDEIADSNIITSLRAKGDGSCVYCGKKSNIVMENKSVCNYDHLIKYKEQKETVNESN